MKDPLGNVTKICYNMFNAPVSVTDANGIVTKYAYNDAGLVTRMERLDGSETLTSLDVVYDGAGRPVSYTDQDGLAKSFERDAFGKVLKEKFPDGSECAYSYDALGRRTSVIDENGNEIRFGWGRFGLKSRTTAAGQLTDYVRDDLGLVKEVVSKWNGSEDRRIESEYDVLGTTVGAKRDGKYSAAALTAFGEDLTVHSPTPTQTQNSNFFTGKPFVEGLGHAFLMRNYRACLAKWQTADSMGYPDGWNALAYCGNEVTSAVDLWGCKEIVLLGEVEHSGYHVATVWAECNHNYYKPKFTIQVGQLKDHPDNEYVKANVDGKTNIPATPNFSYVTTYAYTDADIAHQVTLENFVLVVNEAVPVDEFLNKIIMWEYQVEFDVKEEWEENSALNKRPVLKSKKKFLAGIPLKSKERCYEVLCVCFWGDIGMLLCTGPCAV